MPRSLFRIAWLTLCLCVFSWAQHPVVPLNSAQVSALSENFNQSASQLQAYEARVRASLAALQAKNPKTAQINAQIASLQQILAHVQQLEQQAETVKQPVKAKLKAGAGVMVDESGAVTQKVQVLLKQAQTDAAQAEAISGGGQAPVAPVPIGTAPSGGGHFHDAAPKPAAPAPPPPPPPAAPAPTPAPTPAPVTAAPPNTIAAGGQGSGSGSAAQPSPANDTSLGDREAQWFDSLKTGKLQPAVPDTMEWKVPSTIIVAISGTQVATPPTVTGAGAPDTIPVSTYMKVSVTSNGNPADEFTFTSLDGKDKDGKDIDDSPRFIPENGTTTWKWIVTPNYTTSSPQTIQVQAMVEFYEKDAGGNAKPKTKPHELPVFTKTVQVQVHAGTVLKRLIEGDPDYWIKYGMPGGAGFVFVSGVVGGFLTWIKKKKKKAEPEKPAGQENAKPDEPDFGG